MKDEITAPSARSKGRRALGRGLDSLLPQHEEHGVRDVDIDRIEAGAGQPRRRFDERALQELAASIREHGVVQPLVVSVAGDDRYRIVVGERRWRASRLAGLERVPVVIKDVSDRQTLEIALVENVQRADLDALEEATAYQRLMQDFDLTQQQVAKQVGKSRAAVANTLRLLALPAALQRAISDRRITEGHARALLPLPDERSQMAMLERIERDGLNVRQTEDIVRRSLEPGAQKPSARKSPDVVAVEDQLRRSLGTRVSVRESKQGGRIVIEYYSEDEFQTLYDRLTGA